MDEVLKEYIKHNSDFYKGSIQGECKQCGLCCKEAWKFNYEVGMDEGEKINPIRPKYKNKKPKEHILCSKFDKKTNRCKIHNKEKPPQCEYWPLLLSDLDIIKCPGYYYEKT